MAASTASMIVANGPAIRVQFVKDVVHSNGSFTLSNSGQTAVATSNPAFPFATVVRFTEKYYVEFVVNTVHVTIPQSIGVFNKQNGSIGFSMPVNNGGSNLVVSSTSGGLIGTNLTSRSDGGILAIAGDNDAGKWWVGTVTGGVIFWANSGNPATGVNPITTLMAGTRMYPFIGDTNSSGGGEPMTVNGQLGQFSAVALPSGFTSWEGW